MLLCLDLWVGILYIPYSRYEDGLLKVGREENTCVKAIISINIDFKHGI